MEAPCVTMPKGLLHGHFRLTWLPPSLPRSIPHRRTRRSFNAAAEYVRSTAKHVTWTILGLGLCRRSQGVPDGVAYEVLGYGELLRNVPFTARTSQSAKGTSHDMHDLPAKPRDIE